MLDKTKIEKEGYYILDKIKSSMQLAPWDMFIELANTLPYMRHTFVSGAGRSGLVARSFGMRLMHAGLPAFIPGETVTPAAGKGDLLVAITCTGKTGYTRYLAGRAKELGAKVIIITASEESSLKDVSDKIIYIPVNEKDIVLRAAIFEHTTSLCLDALFNVISKKLKLNLNIFRERHANLE